MTLVPNKVPVTVSRCQHTDIPLPCVCVCVCVCDGGRVTVGPYKLQLLVCFYVHRRSLCCLLLLVYGGPGNSLSARHPVADKAAQELLITQVIKNSPSTLF